MAFITVDLTGLSQAKKLKIKNSLGFETKEELEDYLTAHLISEVKAKLTQKAKIEAKESNKDFNLQ